MNITNNKNANDGLYIIINHYFLDAEYFGP